MLEYMKEGSLIVTRPEILNIFYLFIYFGAKWWFIKAWEQDPWAERAAA